MKKLNKIENNNIFTFLLLLIVAIMALSLCFINNDLVFAEETNTILNFNQWVSNSYIKSYTYSTGYTAVDGAEFNSVNGHKYYIKYNSSVSCQMQFHTGSTRQIVSSSQNTDTIITCNADGYSIIYIWLPSGYSGTITNMMVIDLSLMYGVGNEISLTECQSLFTAEYYSYTTGQAISEDSFTNYNNGYAQAILDIEGSMQVEQTSLNSYYLFTYQMKEGFSVPTDYTTFTKTYVEDRDIYAVIIGGDAVAYLPFKIAANTTLTLNIGLLSTWGADNQDAPFDYNISYLYNGSVINLYSGQLASNTASLENANFTFYIPVDIEGIMIYSDDYNVNSGEYLVIANVEASYKTYNILDLVTKAQTEAYSQGQADVDTDYYYSLGFREGVAEGKLSSNDALENGFWTWFNSMLSGIGSIFNIELFGGITIGIVILIPLLFSVLLLVLRLVRGG